MVGRLLLLLIMAGVLVAVFVLPPPQQAIGAASRIFYLHIPQAWIAVLAFALAMVYSIRYLKRRSLDDDDRAAEAARLGLLFSILSTVTGSIFARVTWGSFWNWDPRETSILVLVLIYGAYFALRGAVDDRTRRAALSAVYAVFAFLSVPFLVFVVPRVMPSLHPSDSIVDSGLNMSLSGSVALVLSLSLAAFTWLFLWLWWLGTRLRRLERVEREDEES